MTVNEPYTSWMNHQWLLNHIKHMEIFKPTDKTDSDYENKIKKWQSMLAIPKQLRDAIRKKHEAESIIMYVKFMEKKN